MLNRRFVALCVVMSLSGMASAPVISLFAVYIDADLHQTPLFAASYRALYMLLGGIFSVVGGALADSLGRKGTFLLGLTGSLALVSAFLAGNPLLLLLLFLYAGMTTGLQATAGQAYLMASVPKTTMGMATAVYFLGYTLSNAIGNYAVGRILEVSSFYVAGQALFALALGTIVLAVALLPPIPAPGRASAITETLADYMRIVRRAEVRLLLQIRFLPTFYWGMATLLIPLLIYRATGSTVEAATYASVSLLVAAACQLLTGRVIDRIGYRVPVLTTVSLLVVAAVASAILVDSVTGLFVAGVLGAAAAWSLATAIPGLVRSVAGTAEQGRVLGLTELTWSLAMVSGNLAGGQLVAYDAALPFWVASVLLLPALFVAWRLWQARLTVETA